jgi:hypothetical protein
MAAAIRPDRHVPGVVLEKEEVDTHREGAGQVANLIGFASTSRPRRIAECFGSVNFAIHTNDRRYDCGIAALP